MDYSLLLGIVLPKEKKSDGGGEGNSGGGDAAANANTNTADQSASALKHWKFARQRVRAAVRMAHKRHAYSTMSEMIGGGGGGGGSGGGRVKGATAVFDEAAQRWTVETGAEVDEDGKVGGKSVCTRTMNSIAMQNLVQGVNRC
jgi:hypothetical protein